MGGAARWLTDSITECIRPCDWQRGQQPERDAALIGPIIGSGSGSLGRALCRLFEKSAPGVIKCHPPPGGGCVPISAHRQQQPTTAPPSCFASPRSDPHTVGLFSCLGIASQVQMSPGSTGFAPVTTRCPLSGWLPLGWPHSQSIRAMDRYTACLKIPIMFVL